jgi:hypothetical protein
MERFKVTSNGLNFRKAGVIDPSNITSVLSKGEIVTRITGSNNDKFWKVMIDNGAEGFVSKSFLSLIPTMSEKVLWTVGYHPDLDWFIERASFIQATAVAIRTDNDMDAAITAFHAIGIKVYGWRWPSAKREDALKEAKKVVDWYKKGLDGYYVDPEGELGKPYDWNQNGLESIAEEFCKTITTSDPTKPFGTTSHFRAKKVFGKLPWDIFFKYSSVFLPQAYWRVAGGSVSGGDPKKNYDESLNEWVATGASREKIVPMAGELEFSTVKDINNYFEEAVKQGKTSVHFYAANNRISDEIWKAIKQAG